MADAPGTFEGDLAALRMWAFDGVRGRIGPVAHIAGARSAATAEPTAKLLREAVPGLEEVVIEDANHMNIVLHLSTVEVIGAFLRCVGRAPG